MNSRQRGALVAVAILIAATLLYPPYYYPQEVGANHGHDWVFGLGPGRIEALVLLAQLLGVGMIGVIAYFVFGDKKR